MSKLKVDEIRSADRSVSDSANITLADDGSTTITTVNPASKIISGIDTFHCATSSISASLTGILFNPATNTFYTPVSGLVTRDASDYDFTFTSTGVYQVYYQIPFSDVDAERRIRLRVWATTDGSVPTSSSTIIYVNEVNNSDVGGSVTTSVFISGTFVLNISNTATRIKFFTDTEQGSTQDIPISTTYLHSYVQFTKIGNSI